MKKKHDAKVMALSALVSRASLFSGMGQSYNGDRDVYEALGYPGSIQFKDYYNKYKRQDIASRIIKAPVEASWRKKPTVTEPDDDNKGKETPFEKEWALFEKAHKVFHYLSRTDQLAGIGRYAILLLGFGDGLALTEEANAQQQNLLYVRPYTEGNATVDTWEVDATNERYGLPKVYSVKTSIEGSNADMSHTVKVHHSRVIHITDGAEENDIYGTPRLESIYNRLLNLELLTGGSAEMFWRGAFPGYAFSADAESNLDPSATDFEDEVEEYLHGLKRYMQLQGIEVKSLSPQVADPTAHIDVQLTMISIATGIPKRILMGSERGELASSQDEKGWNDKADSRRREYVEPWILRPFIDKMILHGLLSDPGEYDIVWPDLQTPSEKEKAEVARIKTEAIAKYADSTGADILIPPELYMEIVLEMKPDQIENVMKAHKAALAQEELDVANEPKEEEDE